MDPRESLEKAGRIFEAGFPGTLTEVTPPGGEDRPWVLHAYDVPEKDLPEADRVLAGLVGDAEDAAPGLHACGMAHSEAATQEFYRDNVRLIGLRRLVEKES